jgi:hypothetical protein
MAGKRWSELDPGRRQAIMVASAFEAGLKLAALIDLAPRPAEQVRGSKAWWAGRDHARERRRRRADRVLPARTALRRAGVRPRDEA